MITLHLSKFSHLRHLQETYLLEVPKVMGSNPNIDIPRKKKLSTQHKSRKLWSGMDQSNKFSTCVKKRDCCTSPPAGRAPITLKTEVFQSKTRTKRGNHVVATLVTPYLKGLIITPNVCRGQLPSFLKTTWYVELY